MNELSEDQSLLNLERQKEAIIICRVNRLIIKYISNGDEVMVANLKLYKTTITAKTINRIMLGKRIS